MKAAPRQISQLNSLLELIRLTSFACLAWVSRAVFLMNASITLEAVRLPTDAVISGISADEALDSAIMGRPIGSEIGAMCIIERLIAREPLDERIDGTAAAARVALVIAAILPAPMLIAEDPEMGSEAKGVEVEAVVEEPKEGTKLEDLEELEELEELEKLEKLVSDILVLGRRL